MRRLVLTLAFALVAARAEAHGPAPAALEVLAVADHRPAALRLNFGLAFAAEPTTYRFLCPSAWQADDTDVAAMTDDRSLVVVASGGKLRASTDGGCSFAPLAGPDPSGSAASVAAQGDHVLALATVLGGRALWRVDGTTVTEVARFADEAFSPDDFAVDGDVVVLAGAKPAPAVVTFDGSTASEPVPVAVTASSLAPVAAFDGSVYLFAGGTDLSIVHVDRADGSAAPVFVGFATVLGPIRAAGSIVAVVDGTLRVAPADRPRAFATGAASDATCLSARGDDAFACRFGDVARITSVDGGTIASEPAFSLSELTAPETGCLRPDLASACDADWAHEEGELGALLGGTGGAPATTAPASDGSGCAIGTHPDVGLFGWLALAWLARRRR